MSIYSCKECVKTFQTSYTYKSHCRSKNHLFNILKMENEVLKQENKLLLEELVLLRKNNKNNKEILSSFSTVEKEEIPTLSPFPSFKTEINIFKKMTKEFSKEIYGYHLLNDVPIKEHTWEIVNKNIVGKFFKIDYDHGNHGSGMDMKIGNMFVSNKTAKIKNNGQISISSYRLTKITDYKYPNTSENIVAEIEKRDASFDYYSILLRSETDKNIVYYWCMIPKMHAVFDISNQNLQKKHNKRGKLIGWISEYASITFSMSSQLWFHFHLEDVQEYILQTFKVSKREIITYADMYSLIKEH